MNVSLCTAFQVLAERTAFRHRRSLETGVWLREDGHTALNLQDLWAFRSVGLTILDFSPFTESRETGADWEWWFEDGNDAFGAAVQAKCLKDGTYDFGYVSRSGTAQLQRLLDYCAKQGDLTPQYCLYSGLSDVDALAPTWSCLSYPVSPAAWGCALLDGVVAAQLYASGVTGWKDVLAHALPWQCIACCPGGGPSAQGVSKRALDVSTRLRGLGDPARTSDGGASARIISMPSLRRGLPQRVAQLLNANARPQDIRVLALDLWKGELPGAVVVVRGQNVSEAT